MSDRDQPLPQCGHLFTRSDFFCPQYAHSTLSAMSASSG